MTDDRDHDDVSQHGVPGDGPSLPPGWSPAPEPPAPEPHTPAPTPPDFVDPEPLPPHPFPHAPAPDHLPPPGPPTPPDRTSQPPAPGWEHGPWGRPAWGDATGPEQPPPHPGGPPPQYPGGPPPGPGYAGPHPANDGYTPPGGILALRPLGFGDVLQAVSNALIRAPKPYFLYPALVWVAIGIVAAVLSYLDPTLSADIDEPIDGTYISNAVFFGGLSLLLGIIATGIFFGLFAITTNEQAHGRPVSLSRAWSATAPCVIHIGGAMLLLGVITVITVLPAILILTWGALTYSLGLLAFGFLALCLLLVPLAWIAVRSSLMIPIIAVERLGVLDSLRRSFALTGGSFWRYFGVLILVATITATIQLTIEAAFGIAAWLFSTDGGGVAPLLFGFGGSVPYTLTSILVTPVMAVTVAVLHVDARIRHEGFGLIPADEPPEPPRHP